MFATFGTYGAHIRTYARNTSGTWDSYTSYTSYTLPGAVAVTLPDSPQRPPQGGINVKARREWVEQTKGLHTPHIALEGNERFSMEQIEKAKADDLGIKLSGSAKKGHNITLTRENALSEIFGTADKDQANALLSHCLKVLKPDEAGDAGASNDERHFLLSIIRDMAPRDPVERMLAVQMAATHVATIRAGRWMATSDNLPQIQAHYTGFNKLARTFAAQIEALRKHRTGGEQRVTVQHVNVSDGGQAIVGNVHHGGGGR